MGKPNNLKTKIFLDSGDPIETRETLKFLGFLDGQTTNPTLISKNTRVISKLTQGEKFTREKIYNFYKEVVKEISAVIPKGSISVEVYADKNTTAREMFEQGREMFSWISNAHVKYPITTEGLKSAERSVKEGLRVNMTLCFSQEQAAAVYAATLGARKGDVFVSPFVGRLDDIGENGMSLVENILKKYKKGDRHVEVLAASIRNIDHLLRCLQLGVDIITSPLKILKEWTDLGMPIPTDDYKYPSKSFRDIPYKELDLSKNWQEFDISHDLTNKGIARFSEDWNTLISN